MSGGHKHKTFRAHAAGCWNPPAWNRFSWGWPGTVAWIQVSINGWCGNGSSITWYGGASFPSWTWGPYCITNDQTNFSWDVAWSWLHARHGGSDGISYPWGCAAIDGDKTVVRTAANGYWDGYNDYGY
jgi:hypothetical protein